MDLVSLVQCIALDKHTNSAFFSPGCRTKCQHLSPEAQPQTFKIQLCMQQKTLKEEAVSLDRYLMTWINLCKEFLIDLIENYLQDHH